MKKQMTDKPIITPVLFIIFNRPDVTRRVFDEIKKAKPKKLYVAADGHREDRKGEQEKCLATRDIIKQVDWDCNVYTLFRDKNVGCKLGPALAIDWLFENEEEGIILEDDCLPNQSFFLFCQELLEYYKNDNRIMHISGNNFQFGQIRGDGTYYFSRYSHSWGWATWRRAWKYFDADIKTFPDFKKQNQIRNIFAIREAQDYWLNILQKVYDGTDHVWDYQWSYAVWVQNGLCVLPNVNLISNIGFGENATHTIEVNKKMGNMKTCEIKEIIHPSFMLQDNEADEYGSRHVFGIHKLTLKDKLKSKISPFIPQKIKKLIRKYV